ncbi:hypothetical protein [Paenibacillus sp. OV219]|uniref:hypothetical protein n=1 Tax=Paenibacillus sp. OV219 TaxID=1884377 RepID=UPI0008B64C46|nr:hypothetical protein [Paenibacillus sp. OV219]SEN96557.1 hypothetical protein SAMN05518847_10590 [Paenibacillus sp. OV219]
MNKKLGYNLTIVELADGLKKGGTPVNIRENTINIVKRMGCENSKTFYFDKLCQMKMPSWTKGRVALVGDAGYCASTAAGMGGSLAIDGAAALADAFLKPAAAALFLLK